MDLLFFMSFPFFPARKNHNLDFRVSYDIGSFGFQFIHNSRQWPYWNKKTFLINTISLTFLRFFY